MEDEAATGRIVLVVEDEPLLLDVIATELEDAGYDVLRAINGERALAFLQARRHIDLLFTDIRLPGEVDGWRLAEDARVMRPGLPVIYATGYTAEPPRQVPGSVFLKKPYRPSAVIQAMHDLGVPLASS